MDTPHPVKNIGAAKMIIKASKRKGAVALALHLTNIDENEHVTIHHMRGFMSHDEDVHGAFREIEAMSRATRATKPFFSVSLNPPADVQASDADFEEAAQRIEQHFGLQHQPRCIIFHEKEGRRHAHCVWSLIDSNEMKAIRVDYYKRKLNGISKDLYIEHGWQLPKGFENKASRDIHNYNLAEWQAAKRHNLNPKQIKARLKHCWVRSDNKAAFVQSLKHEGFLLAKGDKRGFVAVDYFGEVHSLSRATGVKTKELKIRLGDANTLPSVAQTKTNISLEHQALHKRLRAQQARQHSAERRPMNQRKNVLVQAQRKARENQKQAHETRQSTEQQARQAQYQRGLKGIWFYITGRHHKQKKIHEAEYESGLKRDALEREKLIQVQHKERAALQKQIDITKNRQQSEVLKLNAQVSRHMHGLEQQQKTPRKHTQTLEL